MARKPKNLSLTEEDLALWKTRVKDSETWVKQLREESRIFREAFAGRHPSPAPSEPSEEHVVVNRVHRVCMQWIGSMYLRDPIITLEPPGWTQEDIRRKLAIDAAILNTEIRRMDLGSPMKRALQSAFLDGWAFLKIGFHAEFEYVPDEMLEVSTNAVDENNGFELGPEFYPTGVLPTEDHAEHLDRHKALLKSTSLVLRATQEKITPVIEQGLPVDPVVAGEIQRLQGMITAIDEHIRLHQEVAARRDREGAFPTNVRVLSESCWVDQVHNSNVVWDMHATGPHDWRWVAERMIKPLEVFKSNDRFKNREDMTADFTKPVPGSRPSTDDVGTGGVKSATLEPSIGHESDPDALAAVWKVWDIQHRRIIYFQEGMDKPLLVDAWPHKYLKTAPLRMLYLELEEDAFRPIPPVRYMWQQQLEINRYRTKASITARRINRVALADPRVDDTDLEAISSGRDGDIIKPKNIAVDLTKMIVPLDFGNVPVDLHLMSKIAETDIEKDTGLGEVALGGNVGSDTATGVQEQAKSVGITLDLKRERLVLFIREVVGDTRALMRQYYSATRFVEVFFEGSKEIEAWTGSDLEDFNIKVELADTNEQSKQVDRMQWMEFMKTFGPAAQVLGLDLRAVAREVLRLMGVGNSEEFFLDKGTQEPQSAPGVGPGQGQNQTALPGNMPGTASGAVGQPALDVTK